MCGNFDDDASNDYTMKNGQLTDDVIEFGKSFQVGECGTPEVPENIICTPEDEAKW